MRGGGFEGRPSGRRGHSQPGGDGAAGSGRVWGRAVEKRRGGCALRGAAGGAAPAPRSGPGLTGSTPRPAPSGDLQRVLASMQSSWGARRHLPAPPETGHARPRREGARSRAAGRRERTRPGTHGRLGPEAANIRTAGFESRSCVTWVTLAEPLIQERGRRTSVWGTGRRARSAAALRVPGEWAPGVTNRAAVSRALPRAPRLERQRQAAQAARRQRRRALPEAGGALPSSHLEPGAPEAPCPRPQRGVRLRSGAWEAARRGQNRTRAHTPAARCATLDASRSLSVPEAPAPVSWRTTSPRVHRTPRQRPTSGLPALPPFLQLPGPGDPGEADPSFPLWPSTPLPTRPFSDPEMPRLAPRAGYGEGPEANFGLESPPWRWDCGTGSGAG